MQTKKRKKGGFLPKIAGKSEGKWEILWKNDKNSSPVDIFSFLYLHCVRFYDIFLVSKTNVFTRKTGGLPHERG